MKFIKIEDKVRVYKENGFEHGDNVVALLSGGEVRHGTLFFVEGYQTLFEVHLLIDSCAGRSEDLFDAMICKVEL